MQPSNTESIAATPAATQHVQWDVFLREYFRWAAGEHVAAIGPTGSGKTTLLMQLLPMRRYVTVIGTKPKDSTLSWLIRKKKYLLLKEWMDYDPEIYPRRVLWPDAKDLHSAQAQRKAILDAMKKMYGEGGWCVYVDELWYLIHQLKLEITIRTYLQQARSLGITLMVGTQRPAFVPLEVYDQSTHLFFWRDNDETNLKRISGISWRSSRQIKELVANLERHEVLYINTRDGFMIRTMAPKPEEK